MEIIKATAEDAPAILSIMEEARAFQRSCGFLQWRDGYPSMEDILKDISEAVCYKVVSEKEILGAFSAIYGAEPTYAVIDGGEWLTRGDSYITIHRIAFSDTSRGRGLAAKAFGFAYGLCPSLGAASVRIDTHYDNAAMRKAIAKFGFTHCGTVYMADGTERAAYEKLYEGEAEDGTRRI